MAGRQMSALAHLGASSNSPKQKPALARHQNAIVATAQGEPYPATVTVSRTSKAPGERIAERRQKPKPPLTADSSGILHETGNMMIDDGPQEALPSDSDPLPNEPAQPGPSVHSRPVSPHFDPPINPPTPNPADTPSGGLSAIQTVQTYLTHQAQTIQSHLTTILPSLIQGEVRIQCAQLAQEIGAQISSIREEVILTGDQDDPMLPFREEDVNGARRGHRKRFTRHSYNKGKGKEVESGGESDEDNSKMDEADEGDESSGSEGDEGGTGGQKYKKQKQALRAPLRAFLLQKGVVVREEHGLPVLPLPLCAPAIHVKQFNEKNSRTGPDPLNIQYNWRSPLGKCPWNRQATLLLAREYLEIYREGRIKLNHRVLPYHPKVDLKTIQKTIRLRLFRTQTHWKDQNLPNNSTSPQRNDNDDTTVVPCTMEEQATRKVTLTRRRMRGLKLLKVRQENVKKYVNEGLKKELLNMLQRLHSAGMNYDITDSESPDRAVQPCKHWWLSDDVISILQELDTLGKRAKASRLVSRKGNRPLPRTKIIKLVYDSAKTTCLPKNWYCREWYEGLCPFEQGDLDCADPENLPNIDDLRAAIRYLSASSSCT